MKATALCPQVEVPVSRAWLADIIELVKPRISLMVLLTVAAGAILAGGKNLDWVILLHTLAGTAFVAIAANAWNQVLERESDALMRRTEQRPLPAGRMHPWEVMIGASAMLVMGLGYLLVATRQPWPALVALATFASYVCLYTPLKRRTTLNTLVGAIPGALPPVIGWTAMKGGFEPQILTIFLVIFFWQVPHFLAIAWIHREDYRRAGLQMLPVVDGDGSATSRQMIAYCLALLLTTLAPALAGSVSIFYVGGVLLAGLCFLAFAAAFAREKTLARARGVLRASLIYLPLVLALMLLEAARP